ncbi:toxin-antitoxin system YwqK family antitoxin [Aquimarina rhabdastrellae]
MKNAVMMAMMFCSVALMAQNDKPTFEKEGEKIKGTFFHDNGTVRQSGYYNKQGKLDGEWISYNAEGEKIAMGQYLNGKKTGKWFFWNEKKLTEVDYASNQITEVTSWENSKRLVSN